MSLAMGIIPLASLFHKHRERSGRTFRRADYSIFKEQEANLTSHAATPKCAFVTLKSIFSERIETRA